MEYMMLYGLFMMAAGSLGTLAAQQVMAMKRDQREHEAWRRRQAAEHRTTCIVRTRHRRAQKRAYPLPLPLEDVETQMMATGKARCVRIGGRWQ